MQGLKPVNRKSEIEYREIGNGTEDRRTTVPQDAGRDVGQWTKMHGAQRLGELVRERNERVIHFITSQCPPLAGPTRFS